MKTHIPICATIVILFSSYALAGTWKTIDMPGVYQTNPKGTDGTNIVGACFDDLGMHGFVYNGSSWAKLDAYNQILSFTSAEDIDGDNIVGSYNMDGQYGFIFNGSAWNIFSAPGAKTTRANGISGKKIVGDYTDAFDKTHGFIYDGSSWTILDFPGADYTEPMAINGNYIVGQYDGHGFIYDGSTWTTLDYPWGGSTWLRGISDNYILANCGSASYLYDGSEWTPLLKPDSQQTIAYDISGDTIVGQYWDISGDWHGFVYTIPEPATLLLLGLGAAITARRRQNRLTDSV